MWRASRNGAVCRAASSAELDVTVERRMSLDRASSAGDSTSDVSGLGRALADRRAEIRCVGVDVERDEPIDAGAAQAAGDRRSRFAEADEADGSLSQAKFASN